MSELNIFKEHLKQQLVFLERSCKLFDDGYTDEGIRIAVVIRVILHDSRHSISVLKHLNATTINLLSTTHEPPENTYSYFSMGMILLGVPKAKYMPQLEKSKINEFITVNKWWNQVVLVLEGKYRITRKMIALDAANKDGGAHVDAVLPARYKALSTPGAFGVFSNDVDEDRPVSESHLVTLRQMAYELINSPDLISILNN